MKYTKVAIDADSIVHIVANAQWAAGNRTDEKAVRANVSHFVDTVIHSSKCSVYVILFQDVGHKNFRKDILPEYKSKRVAQESVACWKEVIVSELKTYNHYALKSIETDDACAILGEMYKDDLLIVTADKDLNQIPGWKYNPFKKGQLSEEDRFRYISAYEAYTLLWSQVLSSDSTDVPLEFTGLKGIGPKKAAAALKGLDATLYGAKAFMLYTEMYGMVEGLKRMSITYSMMKMIHLPSEEFPESLEIPKITFGDAYNKEPVFTVPNIKAKNQSVF